MIARDDTDLFGGHISTIASVEFCCQVETAGEGLHLPPVTSVHDVTHPGLTDARPVIVLNYDPIWHATDISVPHKLIVNFLESLAGGDNRISLRQALEIASLKFGYFGTWKWLPSSPEEFAVKSPGESDANLFAPDGPARNLPLLAGFPVGKPPDFQGHPNSPLAD